MDAGRGAPSARHRSAQHVPALKITQVCSAALKFAYSASPAAGSCPPSTATCTSEWLWRRGR